MRGRHKLAAAASILALLTNLPQARASMPAEQLEVQSTPKGAVPGAAGWLSTCSAQFVVSNWLEYSNSGSGSSMALSLGNAAANYQAPWTPTSASSSNPSITSLSDTDPVGGANATDLSVPAVTAPNGFSVAYQQMPSAAGAQFYGWTVQANLNDESPGVAGRLFFILANSTHTKFVSTPIPAQTWPGSSPVILNVPPAWGGQFYVEIGVDRRDPAETAAVIPSSAKTVGVYGVQAMPYIRGPGGGAWPLITTTSTPGAPKTTMTIPCPPGIAFRDWSKVQPWVANGNANWSGATGITLMAKQNTSEVYQQGGTSEPFLVNGLKATGPYAGQFVGVASMTDGTIEGTTPGAHNDWYDAGVLAGVSPFAMAEINPGGAQAEIHIPGAVNQNACCSTQVNIAAAGPNAYNTSTGVISLTLVSSSPFTVGQNISLVAITPTASAALQVYGQVLSSTGTAITVQGPTGKGSLSITGGTVLLGNSGTTTNLQMYMLHEVWVPGGATLSGTWYPDCIHFSGNPIGSTLMACATSGMGNAWTFYTSAGIPSYVIPPTFDTPANHPNLPTDIFVPGTTTLGTNLIYTIVQGNGSAVNNYGTAYSMQLWVAPVGDGGGGACGTGAPLCGRVWNNAAGYTYAGFSDMGLISSNFDQQGTPSEHLDPAVFKNRCGFYEKYSTAYRGSPLYGQATVAASGSTYNSTTGTVTLNLTYSVQGIIQPGNQITIPSGAGGLTGTNVSSLDGTWVVTGVSGATLTYQGPTGVSGASITGSATSAVSIFPTTQAKDQIIVEEVSDSILGPWFLMPQTVLPLGSKLYNGSTTAGESQVFPYGSLLIWSGNVDNGINQSSGVMGWIQDACQ